MTTRVLALGLLLALMPAGCVGGKRETIWGSCRGPERSYRFYVAFPTGTSNWSQELFCQDQESDGTMVKVEGDLRCRWEDPAGHGLTGCVYETKEVGDRCWGSPVWAFDHNLSKGRVYRMKPEPKLRLALEESDWKKEDRECDEPEKTEIVVAQKKEVNR